jgi:tRNA dimethylallyltransferase
MCTLDQAVENIKTNTRRYAKRQLTWFRNQEAMRWFEPRETDAIESYLAETILPF